MDEYSVEMSNYTVPFDFDGSRLAWVEFLSDKERNVSVYYIAQENKWTHLLDKEFGHISHMKLLPNKKVFIVRNLNQCEIRELDKDFKIVHKFTHIGDEVIAADIFINSSKIILNDMELENVQVNSKKNDQYIKIPIDKNNIQLEDKVQDEQINENSNVSEDNLSIYLLDIDGNLNVWENFSIRKMFNLYDMKDINEDYKSKQFFSMGYPYYIKANSSFFAISSDHGVFVIKKGLE
jgi:hypothetical protein